MIELNEESQRKLYERIKNTGGEIDMRISGFTSLYI